MTTNPFAVPGKTLIPNNERENLTHIAFQQKQTSFDHISSFRNILKKWQTHSYFKKIEKVGYKNPFGVNVPSGQEKNDGIYNPQETGWGQNTSVDTVENFPQFGSNNSSINNTGNNSFTSFNTQAPLKVPANIQDNKGKQNQVRPVPQQNPFAFNQNVLFGGDQANIQTNIDMNFSMDDTFQNNNNNNNINNNSTYQNTNAFNQSAALQQTNQQPKRFDPSQFTQQQQDPSYVQQYQQNYENLGFDPNNVDPDNEPPLLVELGIDLNSIKVRTLSVLKFQKCDIKFLEDPDMSGPIILGFLFGFFLLLSGKLHFGYVYGFGISGTIAIYCIMNFLSMHKEIPLYNTLSILGYCLMPVIILSFLNIFMSLKGLSGGIFATLSIIWSTVAATNFFNELIHQEYQKYLVAYPILLFYSTFVILTIF